MLLLSHEQSWPLILNADHSFKRNACFTKFFDIIITLLFKTMEIKHGICINIIFKNLPQKVPNVKKSMCCIKPRMSFFNQCKRTYIVIKFSSTCICEQDMLAFRTEIWCLSVLHVLYLSEVSSDLAYISLCSTCLYLNCIRQKTTTLNNLNSYLFYAWTQSFVRSIQ